MNITDINIKILLDGKELVGYVEESYVPPARLWYKDVEGKPYTILATCRSGHIVEVTFNELGYEKHIKSTQPTTESPFKVSVE